jgi:hypothetical protein
VPETELPKRTPMPWLPALGELLVFDPLWSYKAAGMEGICLLRVWRADDGHFAVVTERGMGLSVTNAAEAIRQALAERYGEPLALAEHWTAEQAPVTGEHVDLVLPPRFPGGQGWSALWPLGTRHPHYAVCRAWWEEFGQEITGVPA